MSDGTAEWGVSESDIFPIPLPTYLDISKDVLPERLGGHREVRMDGLPVTEESLVGHVLAFTKKDRHFNGWLDVRLRLVTELGTGEFVVDLVECHDELLFFFQNCEWELSI